MPDIRERIAEILVAERVANSVKAWEIAGELVRQLGLQRWQDQTDLRADLESRVSVKTSDL